MKCLIVLSFILKLCFVASITTEAPISVCQSTDCFTTSGCNHQSSSTVRLAQVSVEHVSGLLRELKIRLLDLTQIVHTIRNDWTISDWSLPVSSRGLLQLNPVSSNTASLTNTQLGDQHRILRELRWWITSIEAHTHLLHHTDLLNRNKTVHLTSSTRHLSRSLTSLLRYFSVDLSSLPAEGTCIMRSTILTDSLTKRAEFISMAVRDIHEGLLHIQNVLNNCRVVGHPTGHHRVRLDCQWSLFYFSLPSSMSLYTFSQLTSSSD